ncbi:MAG: DUF1080 domain-containing protein [Planctomycetes bacterium]|nr:DUF1080 domain-containing protein [Planctomycetota bacterium]
MRTRTLSLAAATVAALLLSLAGGPAPAEAPADEARGATPPKGFTALFNGHDLNGWHGWAIHEKAAGPYDLARLSPEERANKIEQWTTDAKKHWTVDKGELVNDGHGAYLTTDKKFGDIELLIDYKTVPKADSGIYLKATPQVQIWDYTKEGGKWNIGADKGSGGLWNNSPGAPGKDPLVLADKPFGQWNSFRIIQVGARTTIWLNGKLVVDNAILENYWDRKAPLLRKGPILLQTHGGEIRWRNVFIREVPPEKANAWLDKHNDKSFESVFDGKSFDGWAGPVENYVVKDGTIMCRPGKGGTIYTKQQFSDFVARVEYKLPPGGNNGLAIRYPGTGDTAYQGMCEVQVLDDYAPQYKKLDPRQYNGSVYGMVPAHRGYLRPAGQWNFEEVTVKGPTIKVELNGNVIIDADVSKITKFMANSPHPGKDRKAGHFGFAGHSDPVQFRNIRIKPLDGGRTSSSSR